MEDYFAILVERLMECISLSLPEEKIKYIKILIERNTADLQEGLASCKVEKDIKGKFSNYVNKTLSTIEALGLTQGQYKAVRKLVLNEIYGCQKLHFKSLGIKVEEDGE